MSIHATCQCPFLKAPKMAHNHQQLAYRPFLTCVGGAKRTAILDIQEDDTAIFPRDIMLDQRP